MEGRERTPIAGRVPFASASLIRMWAVIEAPAIAIHSEKDFASPKASPHSSYFGPDDYKLSAPPSYRTVKSTTLFVLRPQAPPVNNDRLSTLIVAYTDSSNEVHCKTYTVGTAFTQ